MLVRKLIATVTASLLLGLPVVASHAATLQLAFELQPINIFSGTTDPSGVAPPFPLTLGSAGLLQVDTTNANLTYPFASVPSISLQLDGLPGIPTLQEAGTVIGSNGGNPGNFTADFQTTSASGTQTYNFSFGSAPHASTKTDASIFVQQELQQLVGAPVPSSLDIIIDRTQNGVAIEDAYVFKLHVTAVTAVPELATGIQMLVGLGLLGAASQRCRRRT